MKLVLYHPHVAKLSCDDCEKYVIDVEHGWQITRRPAFVGEPVLRPTRPGEKPQTPCWRCPKIAEDMPKCRASANELTPQNWRAYSHWRSCKAVGQFPDDPIVCEHAVLLQQIHDDWKRSPILDLLDAFQQAVVIGQSRR